MRGETDSIPTPDETRRVSADLFMRGLVDVDGGAPEDDIERLAELEPRGWEEAGQIAAAQRIKVA